MGADRGLVTHWIYLQVHYHNVVMSIPVLDMIDIYVVGSKLMPKSIIGRTCPRSSNLEVYWEAWVSYKYRYL